MVYKGGTAPSIHIVPVTVHIVPVTVHVVPVTVHIVPVTVHILPVTVRPDVELDPLVDGVLEVGQVDRHLHRPPQFAHVLNFAILFCILGFISLKKSQKLS